MSAGLDKVSSMENTTKIFPIDYRQFVTIEVCVFDDGYVIVPFNSAVALRTYDQTNDDDYDFRRD